MCQTLYAEVWPSDCAGCGQPYLQGLVHVGHDAPRWTRTLTCQRPGCGHVWYMPADHELRPTLQRCRDRSCPTWPTAEPARPPFPAA